MKMHMWKMMAVAVLVLVLTGGSAWADVIASDGFTLGEAGSGREVGDPIPGTTTEIGSLTWAGTDLGNGGTPTEDALPALGSFDSQGAATSGGGQSGAYLSFTPASDGIYSISAKVRSNGGNWGALGFGENWGRPTVNGQGEIWLLLRPNGNYKGFASGATNTTFDEAASPGYAAAALTLIELTWDVAAQTVALSINGTNIGTPADLSSAGVANVGQAGFWFDNSTADEAFVDDFTLTLVPEPMTLGVLAIGGLAALRRRRA
jgi:hypothetical protein